MSLNWQQEYGSVNRIFLGSFFRARRNKKGRKDISKERVLFASFRRCFTACFLTKGCSFREEDRARRPEKEDKNGDTGKIQRHGANPVNASSRLNSRSFDFRKLFPVVESVIEETTRSVRRCCSLNYRDRGNETSPVAFEIRVVIISYNFHKSPLF